MKLYIMRLPEVLKARGRSRSSHYQDVADGLFTKPVLIGSRSVGWPSSEVQVLVEAQISGLNFDQIRALVTDLHSSRLACHIEADVLRTNTPIQS